MSSYKNGEFEEFPLKVFTLQDVKDGKTPCTITDIESLLIGQAQTHKSRYTGDAKRLVSILDRNNTALKGIVLFSERHGAIALATLFTGFHKDGLRKFDAEDLFVASDFRNHGVFRVLLHEVAKYVIDNGGTHLQWETMSNNFKMQEVIKHYGAVKPDVATFDATPLLRRDFTAPSVVKEIYSQNSLSTSLISSKHESDIREIGINPQIIWARGDLPFSGFITHDISDREKPKVVAVTAAWPRVGTFDLTDSIVLEHTQKINIEAESFEERVKRTAAIVSSVIDTLRETSAKLEKTRGNVHCMDSAKWIVNRGKGEDLTATYKVLSEYFGLAQETLGGGDREQWVLKNGKLMERAEAKVERIMRIPADKQIGEPIRIDIGLGEKNDLKIA